MAFLFTNKEIIDTLRGDAHRPIYNFVDIDVTSDTYPDGLFLTDFDTDVMLRSNGILEPDYPESSSSVERIYRSNYLGAINPPARTGNVTQEIQRLQLIQGLDAGFSNASADILTALGEDFHNAKVRIVSYLFDSAGEFVQDEPIMATNGIIKSLSRDVKNNAVIVEFSNSFGKLDGLKELRTTPGSLYRRTLDGQLNDTSFDKANVDIDGNILKWGIG